MPSLPARLYSTFLRLYLKRRPSDDPLVNVAFVRRRFDPPQWMRVPPPRGTLARTASWGEIVSWQDESARRAVYFLHGGGYVFGKAENYRPFTAELARRLQARVFALNYRLAPEHPYPAALEDAVQGYLNTLKAMADRADQIVMVGDSAGGGLVMAVLLKLRTLGYPLPAAAVLLSPWVDLTCQSASINENEGSEAMFYADMIRMCAPLYCRQVSPQDPFISPVYGDLTGLPPLLIFASEAEAFRDDAIRLAERARTQGVTTEFYLYEGLPHVWPIFTFLPEAKRALTQIEQFAAMHLLPV